MDGWERDPFDRALFFISGFVGICGWRSTGPGRYPILSSMKFRVECSQKHVWGPPGARVMSIFVKTYIFVKVELGDDHG